MVDADWLAAGLILVVEVLIGWPAVVLTLVVKLAAEMLPKLTVTGFLGFSLSDCSILREASLAAENDMIKLFQLQPQNMLQ